MTSTIGPLRFFRLTLGVRVFGVAILLGQVLWSRDSAALLGLVAIAAVWVASTAAEWLRVDSILLPLAEGVLVGTVCALSLESTPAVLGTLAVAPLIAGLRQGPRGVVVAVAAELVSLVWITAAVSGPMTAEQGSATFTWIMTGTGLGLIGSFLRSSNRAATDPLRPYRDAQALIRELIGISGGLTSGLDPASLGANVAASVRDELPVVAVAVFVPHGEQLSPLVVEADGEESDLADMQALALTARDTTRPSHAGPGFAFPLMTEAGLVAIVAGRFSARVRAEVLLVEQRMRDISARLEPTAVQLDTALLFSAFRDSATADERRRLAREMHDGIAQDIAALGYIIDGLSAPLSTSQQTAQLAMLRERISRVVAEVRQSVQALRTEVRASESLGTAVSGLARHLSETSGVPIRVTADERVSRLRPEIESELLRIAQEAMTNAVRHAEASSIEVRCAVDAPTAEIVVRDDGKGLGEGRPDSYGIEIMRERARLVDADLTIENAAPCGTTVTLRLPARIAAPTPPEGFLDATVTA